MSEGKEIVGANIMDPAPAAVGSVPASPACRENRSPGWMWPHLLSLDAPLVAVGWQAWWAQSHAVRLHWFHHVILGFSVWMIYLADRLADARRAAPAEWGTPRHAFYHRHRAGSAALLGAVVVALAALAPWRLAPRELAGGALLLAAAALYFWLIHGRRHRAWPDAVPKEAAVGGMFALGVSFFVACHGAGSLPALWTQTAFFAALCFTNCALITRWERTLRDRRERSSLLNAFPGLVERLGGVAAGLAAAALVTDVIRSGDLALTPLAMAAAALWTLDRTRNRVPAPVLRVLADVALLTPWLFLR